MALEFRGLANASRDLMLSPAAQQNRSDYKRALNLARLISLVAGAVALFFAVVLPKTFILFLSGLLGFAALELYMVSKNFLEMFKDPQVELQAVLSDEAFAAQLTKNTLLAELVFETVVTFHRIREEYVRDCLTG